MGDVGIPYFPVDVLTGERICPFCDLRMTEEYDSDGEQVTYNYCEHYQDHHDGEELGSDSIGTLGTWSNDA